MQRIFVFVYGILSYLVFFATFLYAVGFVGDFVVPRSIDSAREGSLFAALAIDLALLALFAVQHSVMARPAFKRWWTQIVPPAAERSTYVLFSSLALILLFWQWRPIGGVVWNVSDPALRTVLHAIFAAGWLTVLITTVLINHFDLFGLRQVWLNLRIESVTSACFTTLVALALLTVEPRDDADTRPAAHVAYAVFPLVSLLLLAVTFLMVVTPMTKPAL